MARTKNYPRATARGRVVVARVVELGVTYKELAEKLGISTFYFGSIVRGDRGFSAWMAVDIAAALGKTVEELFDVVERPPVVARTSAAAKAA